MKNNLGIEQNKKNKLSRRVILGVIVSLLFFISVDIILWAIGVLRTTTSIIPVLLLDFVLLFLIGAILRAIEFWSNNKK